MMRRNLPIIGFIIGILLPIVGFAVVYLIWFNGRELSSVLRLMMADGKTASKVMTLSLLANLIPFVYCNNKRYDYTMRGIVTATMLYAALIVMVMFVWK